jgi:LysM repeat protein
MQFNAALEIKPGGEEAKAGLQQASATPPPTLTVEEQLEQRLDEAWATENWQEVISLIEQILAINPDYEDMTERLYTAHVNYGRKLAAERRLEEAKEEFTRALAIKPDGQEALAGLRELADKTLPPTPTPTATPTSQPQPTIYVVRQGDTLYSIARRYGTTVQAIMAANGLTNNNIYVGQQLYIPTP